MVTERARCYEASDRREANSTAIEVDMRGSQPAPDNVEGGRPLVPNQISQVIAGKE
jgi:hypothetical protein